MPNVFNIFVNKSLLELVFSLLMFWRFGFHNASTIQGILDKDDSDMNSLIGEEELLQEVKGQNQKLVEL
jgi:hypothetical protein